MARESNPHATPNFMNTVESIKISRFSEEITVFSDKKAVWKTPEKEVIGEFVGYVWDFPRRVLFMFDNKPLWWYL